MSILSLLAAAGISVVSYRLRPVIAPASTVVGWDSAADPAGEAGLVRDWTGARLPAGWIRLRGIGEIGEDASREFAQQTAVIAANRHALETLRRQGHKLCIQLRWLKRPGAAESRANGRPYLPPDLRPAYGRSRWLGTSYGDLVDAWEIDNEPDLGFVPELAENYAAYLKVCWLGLKRGIEESRASSLGVKGPESGGSNTINQERPAPNATEPLVIMAALGLPPGPWLEHFSENDGFGYTDGFNYHYYGYAEDFTGVYRLHERAVAELTTALLKAEAGKLKAEGSNNSSMHGSNPQVSGFRSQVFLASGHKNLPVFLTEVGYGLLGKQARDSKEGRLRQWRWFRSVGEQIAALRPEAPMAFQVPPYLERDTLEFGLTVPRPAAQRTEDGGQKTVQKAEGWAAGGVDYSPDDFGAKRSEPWMKLIGREIGENQISPALAWWLAGPRLGGATRVPVDGRLRTVSTPAPSPVIIDFLADEGLQPLKRYNGTFVTGNVPPGVKPEEAKPVLPPVVRPAKPPAPPRSEEFMIHVRTANGNLYEVYPTRQATPDWQNYLEQQANFTMSFYGRAELPWRFKDNRPVSLVVVMYPRSFPATYEFRRPQLIRLGKALNTEIAENAGKFMRYGRGKVILYNFADKAVSGSLLLPDGVERVVPNTRADDSPDSGFKLLPNERREIEVAIKVAALRFKRTEAAITFAPADAGIPSARFVTEFFPALEGLKTTLVAKLLQPRAGSLEPGAKSNNPAPRTNNRALIKARPRAAEEAQMELTADGSKLLAFAQQGARVEQTFEGFSVTVTGTPPGKEQRVEVEIPWPDGLEFGPEEFLSLDFRLGPDR